MRRYAILAMLACMVPQWGGASARADEISLAMPNGLVALADFRTGQPGKPAILLLHGFLQTHHFPTVFRLTEALHDEGYTVLAPTLSLGIPHRKKSLACEAIHTHTLDDDYREIASWLKWLHDKGHGPVILIGHSTGSLNLLHMLSQTPSPGVERLIGISLVEARLELDEKARRTLVTDMRRRMAGKDGRLITRQLSFCRQYTATPSGLLSYIEWSPERILKAIKGLELPQAYIMGDQDDRLGRDWIPRLKMTGKRIHMIPGANHFMDGEHEFDLLDEVLKELRRPAGRNTP